MICQISYMTPGISPQYSVRKCEFVVILKFQINDQFALIQFALAVQVIEWGQSMWNMCQDYYFSCFCHIFFSVFILENSWNVMQYFVNINRVQGYQMGVWELRSLIGWYGQRHINTNTLLIKIDRRRCKTQRRNALIDKNMSQKHFDNCLVLLDYI